MAQYVREEKLKRGQIRYYLVESHREGKKVIQKRLKYLGKQRPTTQELERLKDEFRGREPSHRKYTRRSR